MYGASLNLVSRKLMSANRGCATRMSAPPPENGHRRSGASCPKRADFVAKVPKGPAANFPPKNETSDNRRSVQPQTRYRSRPYVWRTTARSPTVLFDRRAYGSENLSPMPQNTFATKSANSGLTHRYSIAIRSPRRRGQVTRWAR